jgi:hypothetical protein
MAIITKLGARVEGGGGDVVGGQILQVLLPRPRRHRHELVGAVGRILRVHNLGEEEPREGGRLGEEGPGRDGRPKDRHIFRSGHSNATTERKYCWQHQCWGSGSGSQCFLPQGSGMIFFQIPDLRSISRLKIQYKLIKSTYSGRLKFCALPLKNTFFQI